jgi:hypothetical protein
MRTTRWWRNERTEGPAGIPAVRPWRRLLVLALGSTLLAGCLGAPEIEDRWTRVDLLSSNLAARQPIAPGAVTPVTMSTTITYRSILTGFAVAELRASSATPAGSVALATDAPREQMALDIDRILATSVSLGRATRAVTGWDHLIQHLDFTFNAVGPAATDSTGAPVSVFLLCYMGDGDRVERQGMADTLIVTPFVSTAYRILPVGLELAVAGAGGP